MEKQILASALKERSSYELFNRIGTVDDFSPLGRTVLRAIEEYYGTDPDIRNASLDLIESRLLGRITNPKHEGPLRDYLRSLPTDVSNANVGRQITELHRRAVGGKLSLALANGADATEVGRLIREYEAGDGASDGLGNSESLVDVLDTSDLTTEGGTNVDFIRLWPKALNDRLEGGAIRGHHVFVFARPENGKTLVAINLTAGFLHQKLSVLYVGNEEPVADLRDRLRGRLLKISKQAIRADGAGAAERLARAELGVIRITEGTDFGAVRAILGSKCVGKPFDVVVFDQIRNMRLKSDSRTAELEAAGIEARAIAKEFKVLVVSISQAGDSATNKVYLEMSDVDSSKTGLPASMDLMIGVGADAAMKRSGLLGFSLPKNKLSGNHDNFTVTANFSTGVIE